ncbi:Glutamyl-tRNA(Gln) amidotransferase subunit B [Psidium guajava]|nr:Glutamyl-tRNA(Gln) amidotransferase subunit B [Psidium guajava]
MGPSSAALVIIAFLHKGSLASDSFVQLLMLACDGQRFHRNPSKKSSASGKSQRLSLCSCQHLTQKEGDGTAMIPAFLSKIRSEAAHRAPKEGDGR